MICPHCKKEIIRSSKDERAQRIAKMCLKEGMSVRDTALVLKSLQFDVSYSTVHRIGKQKDET